MMIAAAVFWLVPASTAGAGGYGYGYGAYGVFHCPVIYAPAGGALDSRDAFLNVQGRVRGVRRELDLIRAELRRAEEDLRRDQADLTALFGVAGFEAIDEHRRFERDPADYAGCAEANITPGEFRPNAPPAFCVNVGGRIQNLWGPHFVAALGRIRPEACRVRPGFRGMRDAAASASCVLTLDRFYDHAQHRTALSQTLAQLNARVAEFEADQSLTRPSFSLSRAELPAGEVAASTAGAGRLLRKITVALGFTRGPASARKPENARPLLYPARAYVTARIPGYYGMYQDRFGVWPGGVGQGGFAGCAGEVGLGFGAPFATPPPAFLNARGPAPFPSEAAGPDLDPARTSALFNPGFGPAAGEFRESFEPARPAQAVAPFGFQDAKPVGRAPGPATRVALLNQFGFGNQAAVFATDNWPAGTSNPHDAPAAIFTVGGVPDVRYAGGAFFPPLIPGGALGGTLPAITNAGARPTVRAPAGIIR